MQSSIDVSTQNSLETDQGIDNSTKVNNETANSSESTQAGIMKLQKI